MVEAPASIIALVTFQPVQRANDGGFTFCCSSVASQQCFSRGFAATAQIAGDWHDRTVTGARFRYSRHLRRQLVDVDSESFWLLPHDFRDHFRRPRVLDLLWQVFVENLEDIGFVVRRFHRTEDAKRSRQRFDWENDQREHKQQQAVQRQIRSINSRRLPALPTDQHGFALGIGIVRDLDLRSLRRDLLRPSGATKPARRLGCRR